MKTDISSKLLVDLYKKMVLIRMVEEKLLWLFSEGKLFGTLHVCIGQEAGAVAVAANLKSTDIIFSNHRCHGHYLAFTGDMTGLIAEVMGKQNGVCGGIGGSQHLCRDNFYSNGIQGGIVPNAVGAALAEKKLGRESVTAVFLGDGTLGQGVVYEAMNIAALWSAPVVFVIENNYYAQSTPSRLQIAGKICNRPKAFDIKTIELNTNEVEIIYHTVQSIIKTVRSSGKPACLILNTYRLAPHSKGDDYRDEKELKHWREKDPLVLAEEKLKSSVVDKIKRQCRQIVEDAVSYANTCSYPVSR